MLLEVSVPWEARFEARHAFKMLKHYELVAGLRRDGPTKLLALEVAASRLVPNSVSTH